MSVNDLKRVGATISYVFALSETFYDIVFKNGEHVSAGPGGAMLNSSVSLGRAGIQVSFISEFGCDRIGNMIHVLLTDNNVSTDHLCIYEGKSPLALAFLDHRTDASYEFYEELPQRRLQIDCPSFSRNDILMFGSIISLQKDTREKVEEIIDAARKAGSTVLYDPNFRPSRFHSTDRIRDLINKNIAASDIIRCSQEDMRLAYRCKGPDEAYDLIRKNGCSHMIYTSGPEGAYLRTPKLSKYYEIPSIKTVSTIGAGDNFNAGIAYMINSENMGHPDTFSESMWDMIIDNAIAFASDACMNSENYISCEFARMLKPAKHSHSEPTTGKKGSYHSDQGKHDAK
ncbi:MAG: PfkB family carbohydrate kinase [Methanolobus sp.]|nr:PfkB family carbohydrate kinase [Methanolobus sp.]